MPDVAQTPVAPKTFHCGSLTYTRLSLSALFAWLLWASHHDVHDGVRGDDRLRQMDLGSGDTARTCLLLVVFGRRAGGNIWHCIGRRLLPATLHAVVSQVDVWTDFLLGKRHAACNRQSVKIRHGYRQGTPVALSRNADGRLARYTSTVSLTCATRLAMRILST